MKSSPTVDPRLPHNADAERALLGGIILGGEAPWLDASEFFLPFHRSLYQSLLRLKEEGKPTNDLVLISEQLSPEEIEKVGGIPYLAGLLDGLPRVSNLAHYAEILVTKSALRRRMAVCELIADKLATANGNASDVLQEVRNLSALLREEVGQKRNLGFETGPEFAAAAQEKTDWIATGLVAQGAITELGAKVKLGKTTLVLSLIRAVLDGNTFLDQPTRKTSVVYLTEQPRTSFLQAMERANLVDRTDFMVLLHTKTRGRSWPEIVAAAVDECKRAGASLLIIDTLAQFAGLTGDRENNSGDALEAMAPLQMAATEGIGVIVIRHERKSGGDVGDSGRGSSAFAGVVDIVLSLRKPEGYSPKTRRLLQSLSRFSETPADLLIELVDGEYVALGEPAETALKDAKDAIFAIVPENEVDAMDLKELVAQAKVSSPTGRRALEELVREGMVSRTGKGKRGDPFLYFLPGNRFFSTSNLEVEPWKETNHGE
jgi:AAA domain/DnaB-like helicase N terminal domain